jgi:hypothetical protein
MYSNKRLCIREIEAMSRIVEKFINANERSPVISGAMLDNNKQDVKHPHIDHAFTRYVLEDGQRFDLNLTQTREINHLGFIPVWRFDAG